MPDTTARLGLPVIAPAQAQKHVTHNEALQILDGITQLVLSGVGSETPPAVPGLGEIHALGAAPTGVWAAQTGMLAQWVDPAWHFVAPQEGWCGWDVGGARLLAFRGGDWGAVPLDLENLEGIGIGTTPDSINRLAVAADAVLLSHDGSGHQLKINKAGTSDTASLLYQSDWTGHAEMGLAGDNNFHLKVSSDGSTWSEALVVDAMSGHLSGTAVQANPTDTTSGRLARADYVYGPGNLLGTVSETGGTPTGAMAERGSNANGEYVRFADGTQICTLRLDMGSITDYGAGVATNPYRTGWQDGSWPALFVTPPEVSVMAIPPYDNFSGGQTMATAVIRRITTGSYFGLAVFRPAGQSTSDVNFETSATAIGRWF